MQRRSFTSGNHSVPSTIKNSMTHCLKINHAIFILPIQIVHLRTSPSSIQVSGSFQRQPLPQMLYAIDYSVLQSAFLIVLKQWLKLAGTHILFNTPPSSKWIFSASFCLHHPLTDNMYSVFWFLNSLKNRPDRHLLFYDPLKIIFWCDST